MMKIKSIVFLILLMGLQGCDSIFTPNPTPFLYSDSTEPLSEVDQALQKIIEQQSLDNFPKQGRDIPSIHSPKAQLGKELFFSRDWSNNLLACADCHSPLLAGTDRRLLSLGMPSNRHKPDYFFHRANTVIPARNAPSTFNLALWNESQFQDGRLRLRNTDIPPLIQYSELTEPKEATIDKKSLTLKNPSQWLSKFQTAYKQTNGTIDSLVTATNISQALMTYMRSQVFVDTPWLSYAHGNYDAISDTAKQGALLFFKTKQQGGFGCAECHQGNRFTDEKFHNVLVPNVYLRGFTQNHHPLDKGRGEITGLEQDQFAFRTPSLLNVTETGPWGHNGVYRTLSSVVRHMLNPEKAIRDYNTHALGNEDLAMNQQDKMLTQLKHADNVALEAQNYEQKDVQALIAFLYTLTDPCVKEAKCLAPWLPEGFVRKTSY